MDAGQPARVRHLRVEHDRRNPRQVLDRRLRHRRAGIGAEDEGRVAVAADQQVDRRELAGVEARIAAAQVDAERDSRSCQRMITSAPVTLPWPRIGIATNFVKAFISAASVSRAAEFMCLPRVIDRPMPKKMHAELGRLHPVDEVLQLLQRQPGLGDAASDRRAGP